MNASRKIVILALSALIMISCALLSPTPLPPTPSGGSSTPGGSAPTENVPASWGKQTKTSDCTVTGPLQDRACTPGAILPNATKSDICTSGYARSVRNVPDSEKNQVYAEYGITHHTTGQYEVDHLISLELGGSNDISNLWPEAASPTPGFHEKDKVENYLHDQVCSGAVSLQQAQIEISTNWMLVYNVMPKN
ncbi:MAG: HNH endonuclease signature motif containing protein [Anaerolineaceae bacterium]|nr:HNH endonuclease signature motif containing protein [Anaerolineaceae bacterium]